MACPADSATARNDSAKIFFRMTPNQRGRRVSAYTGPEKKCDARRVGSRTQSAGTLLFRFAAGDELEVLIVHPSGNYNRRAAWSIPKGLPDEGESLEHAARRETLEETGVIAPGELIDLGFVDYTKSRKRVHAFAGPAPADAEPHCASWEVDRAEFVPADRARELLHADQSAFVDLLLEALRAIGGEH